MTTLEIWTDGSCDNLKSRVGGWAALLRFGEREKLLCGSEVDTTSIRMELEAAARALEALRRPATLTLYTDSLFLVKGATGHYRRLRENLDIWARIFEQKARHEIHWVHVRGHAGVQENEYVDGYAVAERNKRERVEAAKKPAEVLDLNEARERIKAATDQVQWSERSKYLAETFADGDPELTTYHHLLPFICDWKDVDPPKIVARGRKGILLNVLGSKARVVFDDAPPDEEFSTRKEEVPASEEVDAGEVRPLVYTSKK